ncbi:crosslink repair DNA glycosylase YcaQ family protein [Pelagicoccus sp. SDUM812002]|nr:crosslink repair DNA glycosylase YcaQ family protein [Pelagicoccus sp. SDUM812002]
MSLQAFRKRVVAGSFSLYSDLNTALRGMQFVQADPIRCPARAQDLILRQRVQDYRAGDLERLFPDMAAEEGYLFAYGFMVPELWRNLRGRSLAKLSKLETAVLNAVRELGEVHPRDLDERFGRKSVRNYWGGKSKETKRVLDSLHDSGLLRVSRRENGVRVYQVPFLDDEKELLNVERYKNLAIATAHVFGPTSTRFLLTELGYHRWLLPDRKDRLAAVKSLIEDGSLQEVVVEGVAYLWIREDWLVTDHPDRVRILAPFDPLVRNRNRFEQLWGWTYRFEAYVPASKRERGYYAMPVLWKGQVIGWANAKVDSGRLDTEFGYAGKRPKGKAYRVAAEKEVEAMAVFLGLESGSWEISHTDG